MFGAVECMGLRYDWQKRSARSHRHPYSARSGFTGNEIARDEQSTTETPIPEH